MKPFKAWHFTGKTLRDCSPLPKIGKWLHYPGKLVMCESGLHYSLEPFHALQYAPGNYLHLVEIKGEVLTQSDKSCAHYRRILCSFDATEMLQYYARMQALSVIHLYPNGTDDVVFDYLMTGENARAAWDAARAAAWDAARAAAGDSAWAARAARAAALVAAGDSARAARAAWDAARAAWDAARVAAGDSALVAAGDSAWAARAAAGAESRREFNSLVYECFGIKE